MPECARVRPMRTVVCDSVRLGELDRSAASARLGSFLSAVAWSVGLAF